MIHLVCYYLHSSWSHTTTKVRAPRIPPTPTQQLTHQLLAVSFHFPSARSDYKNTEWVGRWWLVHGWVGWRVPLCTKDARKLYSILS